MKYTVETVINAPKEKVAALSGNPDNRKKWMQGLKSYEPLSGPPGAPGAKSRLVFKTGKVEITMIGTVIANNLPDALSETFEAEHVFTTATTTFLALSPQTTKYISEQAFQFRGVKNKIIGFLLQGEFKKQTREHTENFKRFVEEGAEG
jgi:hypothetical protein